MSKELTKAKATQEIVGFDLAEIMRGMAGIVQVCDVLARQMSTMSDEELRTVDRQARVWGSAAYLVEAASTYEAYVRIKQRVIDSGRRVRAPKGAPDTIEGMLAEEAALRDKALRTLQEDISVYSCFFAGPRRPQTDIPLAKTLYMSALKSPDPIAAVEFLAARKGEIAATGGKYTVSQARKELTEREKPATAESSSLKLTAHKPSHTEEQPSAKPTPIVPGRSGGKEKPTAALVFCRLAGTEDMDAIGAWAHAHMQPGGSLITFCEPGSVVSAGTALHKHFPLRWIFSVGIPPQISADAPAGVLNCWEAALWLSESDLCVPAVQQVADAYPSRDALISALLPALTKPDDTVMDAGVGDESIEQVAIRSGRRFIRLDPTKPLSKAA